MPKKFANIFFRLKNKSQGYKVIALYVLKD